MLERRSLKGVPIKCSPKIGDLLLEIVGPTLAGPECYSYLGFWATYYMVSSSLLFRYLRP